MRRRRKSDTAGIILLAMLVIGGAVVQEIVRFSKTQEGRLFWMAVLTIACIVLLALLVRFILRKRRQAAEQEEEWFWQAYEAEMARYAEEDRLERIKSVQTMNGWDYEHYVAGKLEAEGYTNIKVTPGSGDYGADILCMTSDGIRVAVQCKKYNDQPVGVKAVQEILGAMKYYRCHVGSVVGISGFTLNAQRMAEETGVLLKTVI